MLKEFTNLINAWTTNIHTLSLTLGRKCKKIINLFSNIINVGAFLATQLIIWLVHLSENPSNSRFSFPNPHR